MPVEYQTLHRCITIDVSLSHAAINRSDRCNAKFFNMKQKRSQAPHACFSLKIKTTRTNARKREEESVCSVSSLERTWYLWLFSELSSLLQIGNSTKYFSSFPPEILLKVTRKPDEMWVLLFGNRFLLLSLM